MRKFLILLSISLFFIIEAYAMDYSQYTDSELLENYNALKQEMMDRGLFKKANAIPGKYTVGNDLPAGKYVVTFPEVSGWLVVLDVYPDSDHAEIGDEIYSIAPNKSGDQVLIELKDKNIMVLRDVCVFEVFKGLLFE